MWQQMARVIRGLLYHGFPVGTAGVGVYLTYRATVYTGPAGDRAYAIGIALLLGTWAWTAVRSHRRRTADVAHLEDANQSLTRRVRDLERRIEGIVRALEAHDATADILDALRAVDVPRRRAAAADDDPAQVIPFDPHG